ncbi:MAG: hypothetical protein JXE06_09255, partial [Coriobacteriia bacterium]|nr:hypothetical protein [Coriobacteriia bacterium]
MHGDVEVQTADYLEHLLFNCELPGVGCVAPVVVGSNGTVSSAGLIIGGVDIVVPAMRGWRPETDGYAGSLSCVREVSAVPPDCYAVARRVLERLAGPSPYFSGDFCQAVDLSMRAVATGLCNLCTPRVLVRHLGPECPAKQHDTLDMLLLADAWKSLIKRGDPFYNPGLDQIAPGYKA